VTQPMYRELDVPWVSSSSHIVRCRHEVVRGSGPVRSDSRPPSRPATPPPPGLPRSTRPPPPRSPPPLPFAAPVCLTRHVGTHSSRRSHQMPFYRTPTITHCRQPYRTPASLTATSHITDHPYPRARTHHRRSHSSLHTHVSLSRPAIAPLPQPSPSGREVAGSVPM
jgi:hypothetical protein